jgi:hypothetical protein
LLTPEFVERDETRNPLAKIATTGHIWAASGALKALKMGAFDR